MTDRPESSQPDAVGSLRSRLCQALPAILVIVWRAIVCPAPRLWRDWALVLALYWLFSLFSRRNRVWQLASIGLMALLLGIYVSGQAPFTLATLGAKP